MLTHIIHNGGYTLSWSRKCPHCQHWFALKTVSENAEQKTVDFRCQHCGQSVTYTQHDLTNLAPRSPRNLY